MKKAIFFILFLFSIQSFAQKETVEEFDAEHVASIVFDSEEVYKINVKTADVDGIFLKTHTEGEYFNNISLDSEVKGNTLYLKSRFRESLKGGFDKLSAHKVFVMEVELIVPEGIALEITSNVASVYLTGQYDHVFLELKGGSAYLKDFTGNAVINTYNGNIEIEANNISVEAESRHGKIEIPIVATGIHLLRVKSINGNIKVIETK